MTSQDFLDIQNALMYVFGPFIYWWLVCFTSGGFLLAVWIIWLGLLRWISKRMY